MSDIPFCLIIHAWLVLVEPLSSRLGSTVTQHFRNFEPKSSRTWKWEPRTDFILVDLGSFLKYKCSSYV